MKKNQTSNVEKLFVEFHKRGINYCHFKSNEHLDASFKGLTDLDVLFDINQKDEVKKILLSNGFSKFNSVWFLNYPNVEDFILLYDGKIFHVHAHFRLIVGKSGVKSYILPWDKQILDSRIFRKDFNLFTSNPIYEMLLLIVRISLKLSFFNTNYINRREIIDAKREFQWLKKRVSKKELTDLSIFFYRKNIKHTIEAIYDENINLKNISEFYNRASNELNKSRRYNFLQSVFIEYLRKGFQILAIINKRFNLVPNIKNHRTLRGKGLIISLLGADGSGKSTQVKYVKEILSKKMDVRFAYMGSGNGPMSWHRKIFKLGNKILKKSIQKNRKSYTHNSKEKLGFKYLFKILYFLSLAIERKSKLKKLDLFRNKGMICITDRYPQTQIHDYNDGIHLGNWLNSSNLILRKLANFEYSCYKKSYYIRPNLVIKLIGNLSVLAKRRTGEMSIEEISKKQNGIQSLTFGSDVDIVQIDADQSKHEITKQIINKIGERLQILQNEKN